MLTSLALAVPNKNEHILSQQLHRNNICDLGKKNSSHYNTSIVCVIIVCVDIFSIGCT